MSAPVPQLFQSILSASAFLACRVHCFKTVRISVAGFDHDDSHRRQCRGVGMTPRAQFEHSAVLLNQLPVSARIAQTGKGRAFGMQQSSIRDLSATSAIRAATPWVSSEGTATRMLLPPPRPRPTSIPRLIFSPSSGEPRISDSVSDPRTTSRNEKTPDPLRQKSQIRRVVQSRRGELPGLPRQLGHQGTRETHPRPDCARRCRHAVRLEGKASNDWD